MAEKKLSVSQNALYNTIGTIVFCFCQWLTSSLLVVHLSPEDTAVSNAGVLQLAISVTNIFFAISCYGMRTYQISDVQNKYSSGDYMGMRFVTAGIATALCIGYVIILGYNAKTALCVVLYMVFKLNETFGDVFHAIDQKNYRMDYVGISFCIRGVLMTVLFSAALVITGDILISVIAMAIVSFLAIFVYDFRVTGQFGSFKPIFNRKIITGLLIECLPAVVSAAAFTAITTIPRQILEGTLGEEALGYYGTVATPLVVVQVMATSIFNPMLTELAVLYDKSDIKGFKRIFLRNIGLLIAITVGAVGVIALLGEFAIGLVFGSRFVPYTYLMYGIVGCTAMYTVSWLCNNILIIMRRLKICMAGGLLALAISGAIARPMINIFGMNGVSYSIIIAYTALILVCGIIIVKELKNKARVI